MTPQSTGFVTHNSQCIEIPVLLSVPHAGRDYPEEIFEHLRLPAEMLVRLEDRYADLLAREAVSGAVPTIIARRARAWIDLNRDERDIDAAMIEGAECRDLRAPSAKQRGGLGLIPRRLSGGGDIWKRRLTAADVEQRISGFHRPYHETVSRILSGMRDRFGTAILLDLHSMPPVTALSGDHAPRFVIGDIFGGSASPQYSEMAADYLRRSGHVTSLNYPYAGDYVLRRHGNPGANIHAIQLEVDRSLYLDELLREPDSGVGEVAALVAGLIRLLADQISGEATLLAAE